MSRPLRPCPNPSCEGGTESLLIEKDVLNTRKWYGWIKCDWCGVRGPTERNEDDARAAWNACFPKAPDDVLRESVDLALKALGYESLEFADFRAIALKIRSELSRQSGPF